MSGRRQVELVESQPLSPTVRGLRLRCVDGAPLRFVAGQWVNLYLPAGEASLRRAYSIASPPGEATFELGVTRVQDGAVSRALHALSTGARLEMDGPHGFFTRADTLDQPALFVGTGSGVCPLRSMLACELAQGDGPPLALLFGCRTRADILYGDELYAWAQGRRFALHVTLSRPDQQWSGLRGYVQHHLATLIDPARKPQVFVCGVSRMVRAVRAVLKDELGFERGLIHTERYD
jgi:CDP-4-dehydro-6-deoxyglucose reductase